MIEVKAVLFVALGVVGVGFLAAWVWLARRSASKIDPNPKKAGYHGLAGFVFGFFDTLGVGNFAPTTSAFKLAGTVEDEDIPGTLNVGYAIPTFAQAFIYISIVQVEAWTLALMILAAVLGAWLGAGVVARWPRRYIQLGMGSALLVAATLMLMKQLDIGPPGGDDLALQGMQLGLGLAGNFLLGALMTVGIGLYGPCLTLVSLLGMNPRAAFPIMMGSCAFLMPVSGVRFIRAGKYNLTAALALTVAALPAVLIAAFWVKQMSLDAVRWLVVVVVVYTAAMMLWSAYSEQKSTEKAPSPEGVVS